MRLGEVTWAPPDVEEPPARADGRGSWARLRPLLTDHAWPVVVLIGLLALLATLTNDPGRYVGDNRFEFFWAPSRMLDEMGSMWDSGQGLGVWRWRFWPAAGFTALLDLLGLPVALIERLWHTLLLTIAGSGMVAVLRRFRPQVGPEHLVAGLLYAFSPLTATFLIPSGLFTYYALAPWWLYAFLRGSQERDTQWRWAALFALAIFATGNVNLPTLVFALLPLIPAALYLIHIEGTTTWRAVLRWGLRAGGLTVVVLAAPLVNAVLTAGTVSTIVSETETLAETSGTSSWSESWRGLGWWKTYFTDPFRGRSYPQLTSYFSTAWIVLATFAAPLAAVLAIRDVRWRPRLLFGVFMVGGLLLMVAAFDLDQVSLYGQVLLATADQVPLLAGFRNSYKAGAMVMMGMAVLAGMAVAAGLHRLAQRSHRLAGAGLVAVLVLAAAASFPFWTNHLYFPYLQMKDVPAYWEDALGWLDDQPEPGRVLILPGTVNARYTWGSPGDDLFSALLDRPHVTRNQISAFQGTAQAADLITALDHSMEQEQLAPGVVAPILRRLGIRYVLLRNDLDWAVINRPSPDWFDALRADPDLDLAAEFGEAGQNVDEAEGGETEDGEEATAPPPPVEIYAVDGAEGVARSGVTTPFLVSGDGSAWTRLSAAGLLDGTGPVRYTGELDAGELQDELGPDGHLVVTDTNRRRVSYAGSDLKMPGYSYTLTAGEELARLPNNLFPDPAQESTVTFGDATTITATSYGQTFRAAQPAARPGNVGDGTVDTAWLVDGGRAIGQSVRIELEATQSVSEVRVTPWTPDESSPPVTAVLVRLSDGTVARLDLSEGSATAAFPAIATNWVEVEILATAPGRATLGLSEIEIDDLDLQEVLHVPTDAFATEELRSDVAQTPVTYLFAPSGGVEDLPEEPDFRRVFRTAGDRSYRLAAWTTNAQVRAGCSLGWLSLDGRQIAMRPAGPATDHGRPLRSCATVDLGEDEHLIEASDLGWLTLRTGTPRITPGESEVTESGGAPPEQQLALSADGPAWFVTGQSHSPAWRATADGEDLGAPVALDTQAGWFVPGDGADTVDIEVSLPVERTYDLALVVSLIGVVLCGLLIIRPRWRR